MNTWGKVKRRIDELGPVRGLADSAARLFWVSTARALRGRPSAPLQPPVIPAQVQSVLVVKYFGIGNTILALPALRSLRKELADARFYLLTDGRSLPLMNNSGLFDRTFVLPLAKLDAGPELVRTAMSLRRVRPELIFCSFPLLVPRLSDWLNHFGARWTIGYEGDGPASNFSRQLPFDPERHETELNLDLVRALGITPGIESAEIEVGGQDLDEADRFLSQNSGGPPWFAFHCGSFPDLTAKRWPEGHFSELGDRLVERHGGRVVICGDSGESSLAERILSRMKKPAVNAAGRLSLLGTAALFRRAALVVSNDSGLMHLAAAVGTPLAALFGPTSEKKNAPWAPAGRAIVLRSGRDCSPCHRVGQPITCPDSECMKQLTVDQVEEAIVRTGWLEAGK